MTPPLVGGQGGAWQQRRKIICECKNILVIRRLLAIGADVARAEIAGRVVGGAIFGGQFFHLTLPGTVGAMGRHEYPLTRERVVAAVGEIRCSLFVHRFSFTISTPLVISTG